jgi:hypothetical protein
VGGRDQKREKKEMREMSDRISNTQYNKPKAIVALLPSNPKPALT